MYVLTLRTTPKGTILVDRSEWDEWTPGDWFRHSSRAVSPRLRSKEDATKFAEAYTAENPGHCRDPRALASSREQKP